MGCGVTLLLHTLVVSYPYCFVPLLLLPLLLATYSHSFISLLFHIPVASYPCCFVLLLLFTPFDNTPATSYPCFLISPLLHVPVDSNTSCFVSLLLCTPVALYPLLHCTHVASYSCQLFNDQ